MSIDDVQHVSQAMTRLSVMNSKLHDKNRELVDENADLRAEVRAKKKKKQKRGSKKKQTPLTGSDSDESVDIPDPSRLGKKFGAVCQPWVKPTNKALFNTPLTCPDLRHDDPTRFDVETEEARLLWARADLFYIVPEPLYSQMISSTRFQEPFIKGFKDFRYYCVHRVRTSALTIFDFPGFSKGADRSDEKFVQWFKWDMNDKEFPAFPPLLYPARNGIEAQVYQNPMLIKILMVVLNGPSSVNAHRSGGGTPPTHAHLLGITAVNPSLIALAIILAMFMFSNDTEFVPSGKSGINYYETHALHRMVITKAWDLPDMIATVQLYNNALFPGQHTNVMQHVASNENEPVVAHRNQAEELLIRMHARAESGQDTPEQDPAQPAPASDDSRDSSESEPSDLDETDDDDQPVRIISAPAAFPRPAAPITTSASFSATAEAQTAPATLIQGVSASAAAGSNRLPAPRSVGRKGKGKGKETATLPDEETIPPNVQKGRKLRSRKQAT